MRNKIKELRVQNNLSQDMLSELSGISQSMITAVENEKKDLTVKKAQAIAKVFDCTIDELYLKPVLSPNQNQRSEISI